MLHNRMCMDPHGSMGHKHDCEIFVRYHANNNKCLHIQKDVRLRRFDVKLQAKVWLSTLIVY